MDTDSTKIILSYREGCSGSYLGEILNVCKFDSDFEVNFRQDINGVPLSVYHFSGHRDDKNIASIPYNGQQFITCHCDNYEWLRTQWPDAVVYRIIPETYVLDAISASWHKLRPKNFNSVDLALEYIKNYWNLHTKNDPRFGNIIDYGNLRDKNWIQVFVEKNRIVYNQKCDSFVDNYWAMQKKTNYKVITSGLTMENIVNTLDLGQDIFYIAMAIFVFEKSNNLKESQRCWSIENLTASSDLLELNYSQ